MKLGVMISAAIAVISISPMNAFQMVSRITKQHYSRSFIMNTFHSRMSNSSSKYHKYSGLIQWMSTTSTEDNETKQQQRISRGDISTLDARTVADNLEMILSHLESRRANEVTMDAAKEIASLNSNRVSLIQKRDEALNERKIQSGIVGKFMRNIENLEKEEEEQLEAAKKASSEAADIASEVEEKLNDIESNMSSLLSSLPNLLDDVVPEGDDDTQNEIVSTWGDINDLAKELGWPMDDGDDSFTPLWHDDIASGLNGWKGEQAVAMSGARFVALSGDVARLNRAISSFFLDMHTTQHGYTEVSPPLVVSRTALMGTSQLPKFEDDLFKITNESHTCNGEDAFLIPTAEVPLTNMHRDSILEEDDLPISYVALTPCFRAEAGSYGRDTRGLVRTHQFDKVELVKITSSQTSDEEHELLTTHAQACLEALKLPYRKVRLCSGDIGFSARHCYDLEVWLPGQQMYREISSCSNTGEFQARRMGLRYRPNPKEMNKSDSDEGNAKKKKPKKVKPEFCHTINGSGLAVGRTLVAVLENYQMPDGSVVVPEVLRPYMGGVERIMPIS